MYGKVVTCRLCNNIFLVIGKQKLRCNGQFGKFLKFKGQNMQLIAPWVGL